MQEILGAQLLKVFMIAKLYQLRKGKSCAPSFTGSPNNGNPVYQLQGNDVTLSWFYNPDGRTVTDVEWSFNVVQLIATKLSSGAPVIEAEYQGRVEVSGDATIKLLNIQEKDSGKYECRVLFTTSPRRIINETELIVVVRPQITHGTTGPITVDEGNSRTLLCVASGNPKPLITWYRGSTKVQEDPNNSNYTITSANKNHAGTYRCEAVVTAPGLNINSTEYTVAVTVRFKPQHKVDSLQSNQTEVEGRNAEFYCRLEAVPTAITYRWFKGGSQISDSVDYTIDTISDGQRLTVKQVKKGSAGQYSCYGQNELGTGERKSAYLLVNYAPQQVTVAPVSADVKLGQSRTLTCNADGFPPPSYSWKFNGKLNGIKQNTLTLTNADVNDAGNYTCVAKNGFGSEEFTRVVNVIYRPTVTTFTTGTPGNSVVQGTTVTLTCSANGYPAPTYTIKRGNTVVNSVEGKHVISNIQLSAEADTYSCEPQNSGGTGPTEQLQITVLVPPTFSSQLPASKTKTENEIVSYSCTVEAKPAAKIQWILNGQNLTFTPPYNISSSVTPILNSKLLKSLDYLTINRVTWQQHGNFSCLAFNNAGKKSQTTELEVRYRRVVQFSDDHPKNLTLAEGATATFFCKTIGNPATQSHKWQFNGNDIPGESCSGCLTTTYTKAAVTQADAGWYSCTGTNTLGEGPPARAQLLIKHPPAITYFESKYTVNEANNVTMVCRANGVPTPEIIWRKSGSNKQLASGEEFSIVDTSGSDDGTYTCTAKNDLGQDSREITLNVRTRPTSVTSTPTTTQIPGAKGEQVYLTCIVTGKPSPSLSWKRQLNGPDLSSLNDGNVKGISVGKDTSVMKVTVSAVGEKFYCVAVNLLGRENQEYTIRERGVPDAPIDVKLVGFKVEGAKTVSVNVSWTPGYSGGYDQWFKIYYRVKGDSENSVSVGHPDNNMFTMQGLFPNKTYEFTVEASNEAGTGSKSALKQVKTPESAVPPDRGSDGPQITSISGNQTLNKEDTTSLNCTADGNPKPHITWIKVSDNSSVSFPLAITGKENEGIYRCTADNGIGSPVSKDVSIIVHYPSSVVSFKNITDAIKGKTVTLFCGKCDKKCKGKESCRQVGKAFACLCQQGKTGENCAETETLKKTFKAGIAFTEKFIPEYEDLKNPETIKIVKKIEDGVKEELKGSGISSAKVIKLREGSIIADMELTFNQSLGQSELAVLLSEAASDNEIGGLVVEQVQAGEFIPPKEDPKKECKTFFEGEDCKKAKPALIALCVVGAVAALGIIVAIIAYVVHKKKSRQGSFSNGTYAHRVEPEGNVANGERAIGLNNHGNVNTGYDHERVNGQSYPSETPMVTFKSSNPAQTPGIAINDSSVTKKAQPGEGTYADLGDFHQKASAPTVQEPVKMPPSYEKNRICRNFSQFLRAPVKTDEETKDESNEAGQSDSASDESSPHKDNAGYRHDVESEEFLVEI
ncbi:hypothetical protein ACROYT_G028311 [Oculina patagonica]